MKVDMLRYTLVVAYDGTDYFGWQLQKDKPSIAQALQTAFEQTFKKNITLIGASRTDAGVHAVGQVAAFSTELDIAAQTMHWAWNNALPADIMIRSLTNVDATFHPQKNVKQKTYYYHVFLQRPLPFVQRYGWFYKYPIDQQKLKELTKIFVGKHDFRSFCTGDEMGEDTIRTIDEIIIEEFKRFNMLRVTVKGERFMRHMIRRLVGALLEGASRNYLSERDLCDILAAKNPEHELPNAPAKGLMLYKIIYHAGEIK
jgi:tRNA pseudouridine38-40 synthase